VLGAVQTAGTAYNTFKNYNFGQGLPYEAQTAAIGVLQGGAPGSIPQAIAATGGQFIPRPTVTNGPYTSSSAGVAGSPLPTFGSQLGL